MENRGLTYGINYCQCKKGAEAMGSPHHCLGAGIISECRQSARYSEDTFSAAYLSDSWIIMVVDLCSNLRCGSRCCYQLQMRWCKRALKLALAEIKDQSSQQHVKETAAFRTVFFAGLQGSPRADVTGARAKRR